MSGIQENQKLEFAQSVNPLTGIEKKARSLMNVQHPEPADRHQSRPRGIAEILSAESDPTRATGQNPCPESMIGCPCGGENGGEKRHNRNIYLKEYFKEYRKNHKQELLAKDRVRRAVQKGVITPPTMRGLWCGGRSASQRLY